MGLNKKGFTLVELLIVIAILGILAVTSINVYHKWLQRAHGAEVKMTLDYLIEAQIAYHADNEEFFPEENSSLFVYHKGENPPGAARLIAENLHVPLKQGHYIDYAIYSRGGKCIIVISSSVDAPLDLFNNTPEIYVVLNSNLDVKKYYNEMP